MMLAYNMKANLFIYALGTFFVFAGLNHFINPEFYLPLIPNYLPYHELINNASGAMEIIFGATVFSAKFRKLAAWGLFSLLIAFIPSHIYFIQIGSCVDGGLCVPSWIAWLRLILIHPLLLLWVWRVTKNRNSWLKISLEKN
jgi:uncharacterized membrane protein